MHRQLVPLHFGRSHTPAGMQAMSAGSKPAGQLHPRSIALLRQKGIATEGYYSKSWNALPATPDIVITVCGNAANETCPAYLGKVVRAHWGVEDPATATGTDAEIDAAFETAYLILHKRIEAFLALDLNRFKTPEALAQQLEKIGLLPWNTF